MKLRDTSQPNIVAAKIIKVTPKNVTVITEEGHLLKIPLTKQYREDKTLRASLVDILKAGIWIPVNKKLKNYLVMTGFLFLPWSQQRIKFLQ